ncbi:hypothetical protein ABZ517_10950 [Streptomyces scabiei]
MIGMSGRAGGHIVAALLVTCAALVLLGVRALDDLDVPPRDGLRQFAFEGTRLTVIASGDSRVWLRQARGPALTVSRELAGSAAKAGHSSWELTGSTLRLGVRCTGISLNCRGDYVVRIPPGVAVTVTSTGAVTAHGLCCPLRITTEAGDVTVEGSLGTLRLRSASGRIRVRDARSADVLASTPKAPVSLSFAAPPRRVVAVSEVGDVDVELPDSPVPYRLAVEGMRKGRADLENVPSADRTISARTRQGTVRIGKRSASAPSKEFGSAAESVYRRTVVRLSSGFLALSVGGRGSEG